MCVDREENECGAIALGGLQLKFRFVKKNILNGNTSIVSVQISFYYYFQNKCLKPTFQAAYVQPQRQS